MATKGTLAASTGEPDLRTKEGRRYEALCQQFSRRFGPKGPTDLAAQLKVKSAAALTLRLEQAQAVAASGAGSFDPVALAALSELTIKSIAAAAPYNVDREPETDARLRSEP